MAFFDSRASRFLIDDADGVRRDLSAYLTEVGGLPGARGLTEVTALGDDGVSFVTGLEDASIALRGLFDDAEAGGPDAVLGPLRAHESAVSFEYGPSGAKAVGPRYSGGAGWSPTSFGAASGGLWSGRLGCRWTARCRAAR